MSLDNKHVINILSINNFDFVSKKTGQAGQMKFAQCVVSSESEDKGQQILVGELILPQHLAETAPGQYLADFELSIDSSKRIGTRLVRLHPIAQPNARQPSAKESGVKAQ